MASVLKIQQKNVAKSVANSKRKRDEDDESHDHVVEDSETKQRRKNKQRVLLLSSRGITYRMRHFMNDLESLLPHAKKGK